MTHSAISCSVPSARRISGVLLAAVIVFSVNAATARATDTSCVPYGTILLESPSTSFEGANSGGTQLSISQPQPGRGQRPAVVIKCPVGRRVPGSVTFVGKPALGYGSPWDSLPTLPAGTYFTFELISTVPNSPWSLDPGAQYSGTYTDNGLDGDFGVANFDLRVRWGLGDDCVPFDPYHPPLALSSTVIMGHSGGARVSVWCPRGRAAPTLKQDGASKYIIGTARSVASCFRLGEGSCWQYQLHGRVNVGDSLEMTLAEASGGTATKYSLDVRDAPGLDLQQLQLRPDCTAALAADCLFRPVSVDVAGVGSADLKIIRDHTLAWMVSSNALSAEIGRTLLVSFAGGGYYQEVPTELTLGKEVTLTFNVGSYEPALGVVRGGRSSSSAAWPNKTWNVRHEAGGNILTIKFVPQATAVRWGCAMAALEECGGAAEYADANGVYPTIIFADFTSAKYTAIREISRGITITTTAQDLGSLAWDSVTDSLSIATAGPHFLDAPERETWPKGVTAQRLNRAFIEIFIPDKLAVSSAGMNLPNGESMADYVEVLRDGSTGGIAPRFKYVPGIDGGLNVSVPSFGFSSPTITWRNRTSNYKGPSAPSAQFKLNAHARSITSLVKAQVGVSYSITASLFISKAAAKKPAKPKKGKCVANQKKKTVTCSINLSKGRWTVAITPKKNGVVGTATKKVLSVK